MRKILSLIIIGLASSGCSVTGLGQSSFKCGDGPTKCDSVMATYEKTNAAKISTKQPIHPTEMVASVPALGAAIDSSAWPKPVLEPAQVIRVWIAPWTDNKDTLHWPSYVFAEVKTRKWSYGQPDFRTVKQLVPLQVEHRPTAPQAPEETH